MSEMNDRLKKIIFKKLYEDLKHVEIIPHKDFIWFIDRKEKYWYLRYEKSGKLCWRWIFFSNFFVLFSLQQFEFEPLISEWVEEVLNCKINTPTSGSFHEHLLMEEVLNCKINTPQRLLLGNYLLVEEVLNCKITTSLDSQDLKQLMVEEVLNCKITKSKSELYGKKEIVEDVLNCKVDNVL